MGNTVKPVVLLILDGWGHSTKTESNAILAAKTPNLDAIRENYPNTLIRTSGAAVGLPGGQMGNSEVGHLNLGSGRVVYQEFTRVSRAVKTGSFYTNLTLTDAVDKAIANGKSLHIMGLLSPGGVHSHEDHIQAMVRLSVERGCKNTCVHAFLDGRDTPPKSAGKSIRSMQKLLDELGSGRIASIVGRYYAMDRDHRWPRIKAAYDVMTAGQAPYEAATALEGLEQAYARGETDEFVEPTRIIPAGKEAATIQDGDVLVFMNFRSDRARQITRPFIEPDFDGFERMVAPKLASFTSLTEYNSEFDVPVAFPPERLHNVFGEYLSNLGLRQLRIAETEKYAHVTFFYNGGVEAAFDGEDRILINSPKVATYDLQPEMSAYDLTDKLVKAIESDTYDAIICNYANADMVGHTGNFDAARQAIEALDACVDRVCNAVLDAGGEVLITADHGNAEQMEDPKTQQAHTAHTSNPVPLLLVTRRKARLLKNGALCDISPTMLTLMGLDQPEEMTGQPLVKLS